MVSDVNRAEERERSCADPMEKHMNIRPCTPADQAAVWAILEPVIRVGETYALPQEMTEAEAVAYWTGPDRETFVAEVNGKVVGTYYLKANQAGRGSHVCNCGYVTSAAATGRGIARAMCAHSLEHARERGFRAMQFNFVVSTNTRAIALWQRMGFAVVGRIPAAYDHPAEGFVDALVMYQTL